MSSGASRGVELTPVLVSLLADDLPAEAAAGILVMFCVEAGPPGTGKTTSVHALARQLLGPAYSNGVLELNASDSRGIDVKS